MNLGYSKNLVVTAGAYTDGDVLGGLQALPLLPGFNQLKISRIGIIDEEQQSPKLTIHFYNALPTTIADNVAWALSDADAVKWIGLSNIITWVTHGATASTSISKDLAGEELSAPLGVFWYYIAINDLTPPTYVATTDISIFIDGTMS